MIEIEQITEARQYSFGINQLSLRLESAFKMWRLEPSAENKLKFERILLQLGVLVNALEGAIKVIAEDQESGLK